MTMGNDDCAVERVLSYPPLPRHHRHTRVRSSRAYTRVLYRVLHGIVSPPGFRTGGGGWLVAVAVDDTHLTDTRRAAAAAAAA